MANTSQPRILFRKLMVSIIVVLLILGVVKPSASPVMAASPQDDQVLQPVMVADIFTGETSSKPDNLFAIGSTLFFSADGDETGVELWKTVPPYDQNSTTLVADINPGVSSSFPSNLASDGTTLFFSAFDPTHGRELWESQPPYDASSTAIVQDINPGSGNSNPLYMTAIGTAVFFAANDGSSGDELWMTQSPFTSAHEVVDLNSGGGSSTPHDLVTIGWTLFFVADDSSGREIWKVDPPYNGSSTQKATQIHPLDPFGDANPSDLYVLNDQLFYKADDGTGGKELWLSVAPFLPSTASRVTDLIDLPTSGDPNNLYAIGDTLFFNADFPFNPPTPATNTKPAYKGNAPSGRELWKTTPPYQSPYTIMVKDINPGVGVSGGIPVGASSNPQYLTSIGQTLFFSANDGSVGTELWKSSPPYNDTENDADIFNTVLVHDIYKGGNSSNPAEMTPLGSTLYFSANDGVYGRELWQSVPPYNPASTTIVADIYRGGSSNPHDLTVVGPTLFFVATDNTHGTELWKFGNSFSAINGIGTAVYGSLPGTGFAPGVVTAIKPQPVEKAYQQTDGMTLEIPQLGVKAPLVGVPQTGNTWDLSWLGSQLGYLGGTAFPTWAGNSVITGHSYLPSGLPGPFVNLAKLKYGSQIVIDAWGQRYVYEVRSVKQVLPSDSSVLGHEDLPVITLLTCEGFDASKGTYKYRLAVRAVQVKIE
ncbi:MAG: sortase [Anaerolineaceae bacterium]|nr:sortase [Anaerolineaceae bacterium]